jgi:hypothetical protein
VLKIHHIAKPKKHKYPFTFAQKSPVRQTTSRVQGFPISSAVCKKTPSKHGGIWLCGQSKYLL